MAQRLRGLSMKPNGPAIWRAERLGTARWAVPAKEPACRAGKLPNVTSGQNPGTPRQRGQKAVTVQDFNCGHMRVPALTLRSKRNGSGWKNYYKFVLSAGVKVEELATKPSLRRGKNRPAFSIKKRDTTYPYCPCYKQAFYCLVIYPLSRHAGRIDISHVKLVIKNNQFFGSGRFIFLIMSMNLGLLNKGSKL